MSMAAGASPAVWRQSRPAGEGRGGLELDLKDGEGWLGPRLSWASSPGERGVR